MVLWLSGVVLFYRLSGSKKTGMMLLRFSILKLSEGDVS